MSSIDLTVARRIVPELLETLRARFRIMHRIRLLQPIGRRALAVELGTTERVLRSEVELLRQQSLVGAGPAGMVLTEEGTQMLHELDSVVAFLEGRTELAAALQKVLGIPEVVVVVGDSDEEQWVKETLGFVAASELQARVREGDVVAVTGGTTMATLANMMPRRGKEFPVRVVPARGGLGESTSIQADTIAEQLATAMGGSYSVLHVPDRLSEETLKRLTNEPMVQNRLEEIRQSSVVVHGIGGALTMAERRALTPAECEMLLNDGAVSEAFGYYFNQSGEPVFSMTTVGLRLADVNGMRLVIGVAGGATKAPAISSVAKAYRIDLLVTDEGAARKILENLQEDLHGGINHDGKSRN